MHDITCKIIEQKKSRGFLDSRSVVSTGHTIIVSGVTDKKASECILQIVNDFPILYDYQHKKIPNRSISATLMKNNSPNIEIHFDDFNQDGQKFLDALHLQTFSISGSSEKSHFYIGLVNINTAPQITQLQLTLAYQAVFYEIAALGAYALNRYRHF